MVSDRRITFTLTLLFEKFAMRPHSFSVKRMPVCYAEVLAFSQSSPDRQFHYPGMLSDSMRTSAIRPLFVQVLFAGGDSGCCRSGERPG